MRVRAVLAALLSLAALVSMVVGAAVLVAPAARAASAPSTDGGALRSGVGVTGTVPTGGATETFTWPAVAGQHVTFDIAGGSWKNAGGTAAGDLTVYDANGSYVGQRQVGTSSTWLEIVPASTGTYTAVVSGYGASTGSMSFTWAPDLYSSLSSTATTTSTIAYRGRHEVYSWSAVAGQHVTFDIGATSWKNTTGATASGSLTVYDPAGGYVGQQNVAAAASYLDLVPSSTGTYTAVVSGYSGSTGSMTLTFARDVTGTLSNGTAVTAKVAYRGRHDVYTWSAAAGQHVTFDVSAASWQDTMSSTAAGYLTVYDPRGSYVGQVSVHTSPTFLEVTPSVTGTYTAVVSGYSGSTGSMTFTFARDVTGSLSSTVATKATIAYRGRHDVYTWSAVAGKHVTFDIGATSWQNATAATAAGYLTVYDSNGSYVAQQSATTSATYLEITPSMTGTYTAVVSGYSGSTGSMTFTFARDVTGTLAPATPVTARVSFRGRHTVLSWSATAHQPVTFQISGGTWQDTTAPTAAGYLTVYDPSGGYQGQVYVTTTATSLAITPSVSGTYTAVVSGYSGSTGSLVVRLAGG